MSKKPTTSSSGNNGVSQSIGNALEKGRRSSIEFWTRLRAGSSAGVSPLSANSREKDTADSKPAVKHLSVPSIQGPDENLDLELGYVEAKTLLVPKRENVNLSPAAFCRAKKVAPVNPTTSPASDALLWRKRANDHLGLIFSALYAKLLVVCGAGFSLAEVISSYVYPSYFDGFYLYLYFVSIIFMTGVLGSVLREKLQRRAKLLAQNVRNGNMSTSPQPAVQLPLKPSEFSIPVRKVSETSSVASEPLGPYEGPTKPQVRKRSIFVKLVTTKQVVQYGSHFGSFYLRIGAVAFGIGSMIYSGLEFAQYFEIHGNGCRNYMMAFTPAVRMVFTFMQMYFIFLNNKMAVSEVSWVNLFGLMHLIATNLCVWLNVLILETKHDILHFTESHSHSFIYEEETDQEELSNSSELINDHNSSLSFEHNETSSGTSQKDVHVDCSRTDIIGSIVENAAPYLFPCTIEYSLICAAVCFVMWKDFAKRRTQGQQKHLNDSDDKNRSPHHYSVDCARANKGLFGGIFVMVITIMSIIINFVLDSHEEYRDMANLEVNITEIILYTIASFAVLVGMYQVRVLKFEKERNMELDNILLIVAQTGSLVFNIFTIVSCHFKGETLVFVLALSKVIQLFLQTLFILDASRRVVSNTAQHHEKPGREVVTFLLVTNLAMWLFNALEKSRGESHPAQLEFYGVWGWTIIIHIAMPLAIFYRFHSSVCLGEVWKRTFKLKRQHRNAY